MNKRIKLTIITAFCPPEKGAAPYRIINTAKELKSFGITVDIITTLANYPTGKLFKGYRWRLYKKEIVEGIICRRYWLFPSNSNSLVIRLISMLSYSLSLLFTIPLLIIKRPDIIFVQTPPLLSALVASFIGKLCGSKVVVNVSDIWPLTASELNIMSKNSMSYKFSLFAEKYIYKLSDGLIGQSEETCDYLEILNRTKPIFLYRNLTKTYFNEETKIISDDKQIRIVYAGILGLAQGILKICQEINFKEYGIEFHIYGNGIERDSIQEFINNNKNNNIFLYETVSKEAIQKKLLLFDATIVSLKTNIFGAFPSKITMAIASALPIFFSGDGEGYEVVRKYNFGYASKAGDMITLNKNIKTFSKLNKKEIKQIKLRIIDTNKTKFNYTQQQKSLIKFLTNI